MPQSLSKVVTHLVFRTKYRRPVLREEWQPQLWEYAGGVLHRLSCQPIAIGGIEDHVHLLFSLSRTVTMAHVVSETKTATSRWLKEQMGMPMDFHWQRGYGVFAVHATQVSRVARYIRRQKEHHRQDGFEGEYRGLLQENGLEFDERYVWD